MEKAKEFLVDTSFLFVFGQKPQPLLAVEEFTQAANLLLMEKNYEEYVYCQENAGKLHREMQSHFLAGKNFKDAAGVAAKMNDNQKASELYKYAADEFVTCGSYDRAAEELERSAILYTTTDFEKAYLLYQDAMSLLEREDHIVPGLDIYRRCLSFTLASGRLKESIQVSTRLQDAIYTIKLGTNFQRQVLTTVLIQLKIGEEEGALKTWNDGCDRYILFFKLETLV
jgi:tetratricopeptide (TPR) repeat protein